MREGNIRDPWRSPREEEVASGRQHRGHRPVPDSLGAGAGTAVEGAVEGGGVKTMTCPPQPQEFGCGKRRQVAARENPRSGRRRLHGVFTFFVDGKHLSILQVEGMAPVTSSRDWKTERKEKTGGSSFLEPRIGSRSAHPSPPPSGRWKRKGRG